MSKKGPCSNDKQTDDENDAELVDLPVGILQKSTPLIPQTSRTTPPQKICDKSTPTTSHTNADKTYKTGKKILIEAVILIYILKFIFN